MTRDGPRSHKIIWSASAGSITSSGRYTAPSEPPAGGKVVVSARSTKGAHGQRTIAILGVSRPTAVLIGRRLIMTTRVTKAGRVRLSAYLGRRLLRTCLTKSRADRTFTCRLTLEKHVSPHTRISLRATLQIGRLTLQSVRPAAPIASFKRRSRSASLASFVRRPSLASEGAVAIAGAPSSMIAGTSVQLSTIVRNENIGVTWNASAGSITSGGRYIAPSEPPPEGTVQITARSQTGAHDQRTLMILPVPAADPAPAASLPPEETPFTLSPNSWSVQASSLRLPGVSPPQAMVIEHDLIMTTRATAAGRVRLSAYLGRRRLGTCATKTPAGRSFTCRLKLPVHVALNGRISMLVSMRIGTRILNLRRPAPVPEMKMQVPSERLAYGPKSSPWQFVCGHSLRPPLAFAVG
jgi:hypothetical protein